MALIKTEQVYQYTEVFFTDEDSGEEVYRQRLVDDWLYDESEQPVTEFDIEEYNLDDYRPEEDNA